MIARRSVLLLPLVAAACSDDQAAPRTFLIPSYGFLSPIRFNVASIEIDDRAPPSTERSLDQVSTFRLADGLRQIVNDRLVAVGSTGRAVFVIDAASLMRVPGGIEGTLAVHLDVFAGPSGERAGYAEARVARRRTSTDVNEDSRAVLYDFAVQMLNDMNVEFEFQAKRSLRDWLQAAPTTVPPAGPIQSEPLGAPARLAPSLRGR